MYLFLLNFPICGHMAVQRISSQLFLYLCYLSYFTYFIDYGLLFSFKAFLVSAVAILLLFFRLKKINFISLTFCILCSNLFFNFNLHLANFLMYTLMAMNFHCCYCIPQYVMLSYSFISRFFLTCLLTYFMMEIYL